MLRPSYYTWFKSNIAKDTDKFRTEQLFYNQDLVKSNAKIAENIEKSSAISEQGFRDMENAIKLQDDLLKTQQREKIQILKEEGEKERQVTKESAVFVATATLEASNRITRELKETNIKLSQIQLDVKIGNEILKYIGGEMNEIIRLTKIPSEVKALELADQARVNFSLGKKDRAFEITTEAMKLCSTSIPVVVYHIIAQASVDDGKLVNEVKDTIKDLSNLISFKLNDAGSEVERVHADILALVYPVINVLAKKYGSLIREDIRLIYTSIFEDDKLVSKFITNGIMDNECVAMINTPTFFREFHWKTTLDVVQDKKYWSSDLSQQQLLNNLLLRINDSGLLMKESFLLIGGNYLNNSKILQKYLISEIVNSSADSDHEGYYEEKMQKTIGMLLPILISLNPSSYYKHADITKSLMREYILKCNKKSGKRISRQIVGELEETQATLDEDISDIVESGKKVIKGNIQNEKKSLGVLAKFVEEKYKNLKKYIEEHSHDVVTEEFDENLKKEKDKLVKLNKELSNLERKRQHHVSHTVVRSVQWIGYGVIALIMLLV